jgi:hypothetical protein
MPIASITLKMVFVLAWTIGDASLASQLLNQVHFVYSSMSSGLLTQSTFNSDIGYGGHGAASLDFWFHASANCSI